ncbi:MAG: GntR family transcriptional regulator [Acidimicrobiales bacterium]
MSAGVDDDSVPLYLKVAAELRRDIADGQVGPGHRLPPARDLAAVAGVNQNTMFKALRLLRDEGILEFQRGRGISVIGTPERGALTQRIRELMDYARGQGYQRAEVIDMIETLP